MHWPGWLELFQRLYYWVDFFALKSNLCLLLRKNHKYILFSLWYLYIKSIDETGKNFITGSRTKSGLNEILLWLNFDFKNWW